MFYFFMCNNYYSGKDVFKMHVKQIAGYSVIGLGLSLAACSGNNRQNADAVRDNAKEIVLERDTITHVPFDCYIPNSRQIGVIKDSSGKAISQIVEVVTKIKR